MKFPLANDGLTEHGRTRFRVHPLLSAEDNHLSSLGLEYCIVLWWRLSTEVDIFLTTFSDRYDALINHEECR